MRVNIDVAWKTWPAPWKAAWIATISDIVCAVKCKALQKKNKATLKEVVKPNIQVTKTQTTEKDTHFTLLTSMDTAS